MPLQVTGTDLLGPPARTRRGADLDGKDEMHENKERPVCAPIPRRAGLVRVRGSFHSRGRQLASVRPVPVRLRVRGTPRFVRWCSVCGARQVKEFQTSIQTALVQMPAY
jgi:hypothetical protein